MRYEFRNAAGRVCCRADDAALLCPACRPRAAAQQATPPSTTVPPDPPRLEDAIKALREQVEARRPALPTDRRQSRDEERLSQAVDAALRQVDDGVGRLDMLDFPELEPLRGRRGLRWLEGTLDALERLRAEAERREATAWPRAFRYVGPPPVVDARLSEQPAAPTDPRFRTQVDGRFLEPGDEVMLTEAQARAWSDRFEPVAAG